MPLDAQAVYEAMCRPSMRYVKIKRYFAADEACQRLAQIPGIGVLTAICLVATVGDAGQFYNDRLLVDKQKKVNVAAVATANTNERIAWALLFYGDRYDPDYGARRLWRCEAAA